MTTAERMKLRRKELGLSAEYVADKLGCSAATIYRYEKGDIEKMPLDILKPLSFILCTSPAYLMGWDDSVEDESHEEGLTSDETKLLSLYRELNEEGQKKLLGYASDLAATGNYKKNNKLCLSDRKTV